METVLLYIGKQIALDFGFKLARKVLKIFACVVLGAAIVAGSCTGASLLTVSTLGTQAVMAETGDAELDEGNLIVGPLPNVRLDAPGFVSDAQRFALALDAWGDVGLAIIATAISFAEDDNGNPARMSGANFDGSHDLGLWQINSQHWRKFGGQAALEIPTNNAAAAHAIYLGSGWCAWSTYESSCGRGHTGSYRGNLACARLLSTGSSCR